MVWHSTGITKGSVLYSTMFMTDDCGFSDVWKAWEMMGLIAKQRGGEESRTNRGWGCGRVKKMQDIRKRKARRDSGDIWICAIGGIN